MNKTSTEQQSPERRKLLGLLDQTLDAMPDDSAPDQLPLIALVLIGQILASAFRQGILPVTARVSALTAARAALNSVPPTRSLTDFRRDAKAALADADLGV